jgi:hypothetical protein
MAKTRKPGPTELASMVAGCAAGDGHLVLADWLEEKLSMADLAATLRASRQDSKGKKDSANDTTFYGFRYRQLDPHVLVYMTGYRRWRRGAKGLIEGYLVGLTLGPESGLPPQLWSRSIGSTQLAEAAQRLWDDLGKDIPYTEDPD